MGNLPKVALLVETARGIGRELLHGVARYSKLHGPWSFFINPGDYKQVVPKIKEWGGDGIIARIADKRIAEAVLSANVPTIALGLNDEQMEPGNPLAELSEISSDPLEVSKLAAEHLLQRQFTEFAYVGCEDRGWSKRRERTYYNYLSSMGYNPYVYRQPRSSQMRTWEREQKLLAKWISELPTPIGLFACDDDRGRQVLEACQVAGLRVPLDIAVVGVDNDEVFCELADPSLSSVALNAETAGFRAAELLDNMIHGRKRKRRRIVVEALGVVARRSTDIFAVEDEDITSALQFIQKTMGKDISVNDVVNHVNISRRNLERRFREALGCSILEEIHLLRVEQAKRLLRETSYPISQVAHQAGFKTTQYFIQFFQKRVGKTPRRFRLDLAS